MEKRFLIATDEVYYPAACFDSVKFKINLGEEFVVRQDDEFVEIYDKETDKIHKLQDLIDECKVKYIGEKYFYYADDPTGEKYGVMEVSAKYVLVGI